MTTLLTPQLRMDAAFDNYLALSDVLREDLVALLNGESDSPHRRRNFVRASASLIEGYAHCVREICTVSFECASPAISRRETDVLRSERSFDANERVKLTLRVAYKLFELQPTPDFGGHEWPRARRVLTKRHQLMHPMSPADLEISDDLWIELRDDASWLVEQVFNFMTALQKKHGC